MAQLLPEYRRNEYVYKDLQMVRMSKAKLYNVLYAVIMCHASIPTTFGIGIYNYTAAQNAYNAVDIKIHIHPEYISKFEELSGLKLQKPIQIQLNNGC